VDRLTPKVAKVSVGAKKGECREPAPRILAHELRALEIRGDERGELSGGCPGEGKMTVFPQ
jgi:hypothetical protein